MEIHMNKLTFDYNDDGEPVDALVGFSTGMDQDAQYIYANIKLIPADLPEEKKFDDMTPGDLVAIARNKLVEDVKPTVTATN